ncbi:MAG: alpha/beta hydrolase [Magnetococcales bacterium]|nr:alpha/beta hydrolase [Magnetococcales bacterium]
MPAGSEIPEKAVWFAHGKLGTPTGRKIQTLATIAKTLGYHVESPDYTDLADPDQRAERLLSLNPVARRVLVLVGSSMGSYQSVVVSDRVCPQGLFLLAPAVYLDSDYYDVKEPIAQADRIQVVHGWRDSVVPVGNAIRFARTHKADLHVADAGHRLLDAMPMIETLFHRFLLDLDQVAIAS